MLRFDFVQTTSFSMIFFFGSKQSWNYLGNIPRKTIFYCFPMSLLVVWLDPRELLDSRQKRISPPVKCAPSTSCVRPIMTAVTVRKEDLGLVTDSKRVTTITILAMFFFLASVSSPHICFLTALLDSSHRCILYRPGQLVFSPDWFDAIQGPFLWMTVLRFNWNWISVKSPPHNIMGTNLLEGLALDSIF